VTHGEGEWWRAAGLGGTHGPGRHGGVRCGFRAGGGGERLFNGQAATGATPRGERHAHRPRPLDGGLGAYTETSLRAWLRDPKQQKPRAHMPKLELTDGEVRTLAAYLSSLR
jgi:cytochrome c1